MSTASTKATKPKKLTPAMQQFHHFKEKYPGTVLFFRMGDFYEMFYDDAKLAHRVLGVTLTERSKGQPMAGVPFHAVESYIARMVKAGYRVAICDQMEDASQAKGVVRRDVTRVITPGTLTDDSHLAADQVNTLAAVFYHNDNQVSLAWAELSTGSFQLATLSADAAPDEIARIAPSELLFCETSDNQTPPRIQSIMNAIGCAPAPRPGWQFRHGEAIEILKRQYQVNTLQGFGFDDDDLALGVASAVVHYLLETQCSSDTGRLAHLHPPKRFARQNHLIIDQTSLRSLEVSQTLRSAQTENSLLSTLQNCVTAMGKRMLRHWLCYPLCEKQPIEDRQRVVEALVSDSRFLEDLREVLDQIHDIPRIIARLAVGRATPRDLVGLGRSASTIQAIEHLLAERPTVKPHHQKLAALLPVLTALSEQITAACVDTPPAHMREGGLIRDGFDAELDEYRSLQRDSHAWLAQYQADLLEAHNIPNLKVGYNKVFGYYIELTAVNRDKAPDSWTRKQTLKNAERFITPELKEFEGKVLSAESRAIARELDLFNALSDKAAKLIEQLQSFAELVSELDCLGCFALTAVKNRYVRPVMTEDPVLIIQGGRHPVLDKLLGDQFVPNDTLLGQGQVDLAQYRDACCEQIDLATLGLITGPNMAGKSTYIRQTALITLLAHTGSFVPADLAVVGLTDRIFTRIGASDELHTGQSTFMVEMTETANICHHATERSLIILDEIGRGTSTLDGLSLAWAIAEFIAQSKARALFATHYHELTTLADQYPHVANLNVTVREWQDQIVFLHRIAPGSTNRSYGIHVAKIAGLPDPILKRANILLSQLAVSHEAPSPAPESDSTTTENQPATNPGQTPATTAPPPQAASPAPSTNPAGQLPLFSETVYRDHPVLDQIKNLDLMNLTPMAAFDLVRKLHEQTLAPPQED